MASRTLSSEQRYSLERRTSSYQADLRDVDGLAAWDYLVEDRGLTEATIERFRLGVVVDPVDSSDPLGFLTIPFITPTGVTALRFRRPPSVDTGPKYWQPPGTTIGIYNTPAVALGGKSIVVCEGEFDCMIASQMGLPAVGYPGASSWKPYHWAVFEGYETVHILGDNDDKGAGADFCEKVASEVPNPKVHMMPEGHDLSSFYKEAGEEEVLAFLKLSREEFR